MEVSQWDVFMESYNERKAIEQYQENRILVRPKTTKITVAIYLIGLLLILLGGAVFLLGTHLLMPWIKIPLFLFFVIGVIESYCRLVAIKFVECYQHYAKAETRKRCKCIPSCSEYAILCFKKYGFFYALAKIRKRLFVTCQGFDYIVDHP